ncbi:ORF6N domain-containing protein [uncultured Weissella sp.]|uniref:ORF6N domain-containing protein n=1 Tax=Weissella viridescens TaxID=1629 RepID=UPI0027DE7799|nr:ORF6N domain-containing protein [uncultured Weissella sp.]
MNDEIRVLGVEEIDGNQFTGIVGGFGAGKRSMLVRDIAEVNRTTTKQLNQNIERNRKRFKSDVDVIDLKKKSGVTQSDLKNMGYSQSAINGAMHIYLLSERGYAKLLKIMDSDEAWEQYDKFVDGYFQYRETVRQAGRPLTATEQLRLASESVVELDDRVTALESEKVITPTDYDYLQRLISNRVSFLSEIHHLNKKQRGPLFKDLNSQIKQVTGASNRSRIKDKDYDKVVAFIGDWTPSTAALYAAEQTELEVE